MHCGVLLYSVIIIIFSMLHYIKVTINIIIIIIYITMTCISIIYICMYIYVYIILLKHCHCEESIIQIKYTYNKISCCHSA